jgi:hypothetical protein
MYRESRTNTDRIDLESPTYSVGSSYKLRISALFRDFYVK